MTKLIKGNIKQGSLNMAISLSPLDFPCIPQRLNRDLGAVGWESLASPSSHYYVYLQLYPDSKLKTLRKLLQPQLLQVFNGNAAPSTPCPGEEGKKESWTEMVVRNG